MYILKKSLIILLFIPIFASGQGWAPIGAKWIYDHSSGSHQYLTIIESIKDTIIKNKPCRKLVTNRINEKVRQDGIYYWDTIQISDDFIYDSNDTVYHYNKYDSSFYPLYLLNIEVNDTILIREETTPCTQSEYFCSRFEYVVDSISTLSLQENILKLIYNSETSSSDWMFNRSWNYENYPIVEKIGSLKYLFGVYRYFVMEGDITCLRCYTDNTISFKSINWTKECDYLRPLNGPSSAQNDIFNGLIVFPNPFTSYIKISNQFPMLFELYDTNGKLLIKGNETVLNTTSLEEGIYLLKLTTPSKTVSKTVSKTIKIVKQLP